jgi:glycosyltransferase involved in cell wall biosynthesis
LSGVLVHEWLSRRGGSENVLVELARIFPEAKIAALWDDAPERFERGRVTETWLARTPLRHHKALALPLMPTTWRHLPASDAEWVLASSHLFAHHARFAGPARDARKFVYTHTPARYIWTPELDMRGDNRLARAASRPLQGLDRRRAQEAHSIAANSRFVSERIARTWERDSIVIHPPVSVERYATSSEESLTAGDAATLAGLPETFVLGASRFVPYKRLDVAIETGAATGTPVVLAGDGPDEPRLREIAAQHPGLVTFINKPSTALLNQLYRRALVLVFPAIEDFGIMPVEAMAAGTPVIASTQGGVAESVIHGVTGALTEHFDASSLREALSVAAATDSAACVARAWEFDVSVFDERIRSWIAGTAN